MNILRHELRQNLGKTIIWILGIIAFAAMYISIFSEISGSYGDLVQNFPEAFKKTLGLTNEGFSTFPALYALVLNMIILVGSVQAMNLGTGLISKEVRNKTADFLLSKPVNRSAVLTQKMLAGLLILVVTNIVYLISTRLLIQALIDESYSLSVYLESSAAIIMVQLFFFFLGYFMGAVLPKIKSVIAVSLPVVFGFYVFGLLDTVIGVEKIKWLTPFKFFKLAELTKGAGYAASSLIYLGVLLAAFLTATYIIYQKKDIHAI